MKKALLVAAIVVVLLVAAIVARTLAFGPPELERVEEVSVDVDRDAVARHLSEALQFPTISP
jgi:hypothetical protein